MSVSKIYAAHVVGLRADIVTIEVDLSNGLHAFSIVGLGDRAVEESKDRISAAIKNSGFVSPKQRNQKVIISLAPADMRKEGTIFELGMALAYLSATGDLQFESKGKIFLGELSLEGKVHRVHGILAMIRSAKERGFECAFVPKENSEEAALVSGIKIYPVRSLSEVICHLSNTEKMAEQPATNILTTRYTGFDLSDIYGQESAKRALEVAAVGRHNIAMYGPPGTGKTMLAKAFLSILPKLSPEEVLEVTAIHSIAQTSVRTLPSKSDAENSEIITSPPFRAPHHTSPYSAIIGGGGSPRPGEITLAHRGVLFLDEFTEFDRRTIDSLRQPLEEKSITITRTKESMTYPADCIYILAMNPCPCGGKNGKRNCVCSNADLARYRKKISGPIADRIDIWISVSKVEYEKFSSAKSFGGRCCGDDNETHSWSESKRAALRVYKAREFNKKHANLGTLEEKISKESLAILLQSARELDFSGRAYTRTLQVARTVANLDLSEEIKKEHILEALQYRQRD
jgi:magnesium chelatase family protein